MVELQIGTETLNLSYEEFEDRVKAGRVPADALVRFGPITGTGWVPAHSLEWIQDLQSDRPTQWGRALLSGPAPLMTALLVGVQIRIWWLAHVTEVQFWTTQHLTNWAPPILEDGEVWRLLTMGFVHLEWKHLALNMLFFVYTAWNLERLYGKANMLLIFLGSVFGGSLLSMWGSPASPSLGSSGGIFGLMAASVVVGLIRPDLVPPRARMRFGLALAPYLILVLWSGLQDSGIDNWSHLGGLVTGGLLALCVDPPSQQRSARWNHKVRGALVGCCLGAMTLLAQCGPQLSPIAPHLEVRLAASGKPKPPPPQGHQEWTWSAPLGWKPGRSVVDEPAFVSPSGTRSWGVYLERGDRVQSTVSAYTEWRNALLEAWPDAAVTSPEPTVCAPGVEGLVSMVRIRTPLGVRDVTWCGATRGVTSLYWIWEVAPTDEGHLAPLFGRLWSQITWNEPEALMEARRLVETNPSLASAQSKLALALARQGECEASTSIFLALLDKKPEDSDLWEGLFMSHSLNPQGCPDPRPWWAQGLSATASSSVWGAMADSMMASGASEEALGTRILARFRFPKSRRVRRALERHGLALGLDPITDRPWALDHRLDSLSDRDPAQVALWTHPSPDLALARSVREVLTEERERMSQQILSGTIDAHTGLAILRNGHPPDHSLSEVRLLRSDLKRAAENNGPSWIPKALSPFIPTGLEVLPPADAP